MKPEGNSFLRLVMVLLIDSGLSAQALFQGLNQPIDARGWGTGTAICPPRSSASGMAVNPALLAHLQPQWQGSYTRFVLDIRGAGVSAVLPLSLSKGRCGLVYNYLHYGTFERRDAEGNAWGNYSVQDQYLRLGYGRPLSARLSLGGLVGLAYSVLDEFTAYALFSSFSCYYYEPRTTTAIGITLNNLPLYSKGYQTNKESLPRTVNAGWSKKLEHLPMVLSLEGTTQDLRSFWLKVGGEFNFGERFFIRWGTSTRRFQLASQNTLLNFTRGTSLGIGLKHRAWHFDTSWLSLGHAGQLMAFSLGQDL